MPPETSRSKTFPLSPLKQFVFNWLRHRRPRPTYRQTATINPITMVPPIPPVSIADQPDWSYSESNGFCYKGIPRTTQDDLLVFLSDKELRKPHITTRQRKEARQVCSKKALIAQHHHYELDYTATDRVVDLKKRLLEAAQDGKCLQPPTLRSLEHELEKKYTEENNAKIEQVEYDAQMKFVEHIGYGPVSAAEHDLDRFFAYYFPEDGSSTAPANRNRALDLSKIKPSLVQPIEDTCKERGLKTRIWKYNKRHAAIILLDFVLVIGADADAVERLYLEITNQKSRDIDRVMAERRNAHDALMRERMAIDHERHQTMQPIYRAQEQRRQESAMRNEKAFKRFKIEHEKFLVSEGFKDEESDLDADEAELTESEKIKRLQARWAKGKKERQQVELRKALTEPKDMKGTYIIRCDEMADRYPELMPKDGFRMTIRDDPERKCHIKGRSSFAADIELGAYKNVMAHIFQYDELPSDYTVAKGYKELDEDGFEVDSEYDTDEEMQRKKKSNMKFTPNRYMPFYFLHRGINAKTGKTHFETEHSKSSPFDVKNRNTLLDYNGVFNSFQGEIDIPFMGRMSFHAYKVSRDEAGSGREWRSFGKPKVENGALKKALPVYDGNEADW
ncbi:hypothetical protein BJ508DRAFT_379257 [Ascobolus immersus RN42]|uniref:Uncharacterized protein n=1 Tax=Ascobolus immersus RN42 TaxID=1160509 RepID=A0A3N4HSN4_ASCIM|nr:hypothetical protein BJ508DRAFT_379257 [Ascobolus immersus RN42]